MSRLHMRRRRVLVLMASPAPVVLAFATFDDTGEGWGSQGQKSETSLDHVDRTGYYGNTEDSTVNERNETREFKRMTAFVTEMSEDEELKWSVKLEVYILRDWARFLFQVGHS